VIDLERRLRFSMVAYVGGSRPAVSCQLVAEALIQRAQIPHDAFSVHSYRPDQIQRAQIPHRFRHGGAQGPCGCSPFPSASALHALLRPVDKASASAANHSRIKRSSRY
jgi:hypothetical protein